MLSSKFNRIKRKLIKAIHKGVSKHHLVSILKEMFGNTNTFRDILLFWENNKIAKIFSANEIIDISLELLETIDNLWELLIFQEKFTVFEDNYEEIIVNKIFDMRNHRNNDIAKKVYKNWLNKIQPNLSDFENALVNYYLSPNEKSLKYLASKITTLKEAQYTERFIKSGHEEIFGEELFKPNEAIRDRDYKIYAILKKIRRDWVVESKEDADCLETLIGFIPGINFFTLDEILQKIPLTAPDFETLLDQAELEEYLATHDCELSPFFDSRS